MELLAMQANFSVSLPCMASIYLGDRQTQGVTGPNCISEGNAPVGYQLLQDHKNKSTQGSQ